MSHDPGERHGPAGAGHDDLAWRRRRRQAWHDYGPYMSRWRRPRRVIFGVCAWLADYFDVETWAVRLIAIVGLIFMTSIVLPAYIIAAIVLRVQRRRRLEALADWAEAEMTPGAPSGPSRLPGTALRDTEIRMKHLEAKLRRMEAHVTSGHFELQRAFRGLES